MEDLIIELLNEDFLTEDNSWKPYGYRINELESTETEIYVTEEISLLFQRMGYSKDSYSIDLVEVFENPGITCSCLCVAWISDGKINSFNTEIYVY